jgi:hypothetical protein
MVSSEPVGSGEGEGNDSGSVYHTSRVNTTAFVAKLKPLPVGGLKSGELGK